MPILDIGYKNNFKVTIEPIAKVGNFYNWLMENSEKQKGRE